MKKNVLAVCAICLLACAVVVTSCSHPIDTTPPKSDACLNGVELFATHNGTVYSFNGTIAGSTVTFDAPANISSWTNIWLRINIDYDHQLLLNGTGTTYSDSDAEHISSITPDTLTSILVKGDGRNDKTYSVTFNKKLFVEYYKNTNYSTPNWSSIRPSSVRHVYSTGDKISLPSTEVENSYYRQLGWTTSADAQAKNYNVGAEITVTQTMVDAGVLDLYTFWSKYSYGQQVTSVTDIDGHTQTGYVAYICGNNDAVKAASSKPDADWTYLIVSKYGNNKLTDKTWTEATTGFNSDSTGVYLPSKKEMEKIVLNLWETGNNQTTIFGSILTNWLYFWANTEDDGDNTKAYQARVKYENNEYVDHISSEPKTQTVSAIGVSYIE